MIRRNNEKNIGIIYCHSNVCPVCVAAEITPYVGVGLVIDKAGTSAKRVKFDASKVPTDIPHAFVANAGDNMDFDMAFAGEITAGVKNRQCSR